MNDEDGFTIVDETFGVREASDASDTASECSVRDYASHLNTTTPVSLVQRPLENKRSNCGTCVGDEGEGRQKAALGPELATNKTTQGVSSVINGPEERAWSTRNDPLMGTPKRPRALNSNSPSSQSRQMLNVNMTSVELDKEDTTEPVAAVAATAFAGPQRIENDTIAAHASVGWHGFRERVEAASKLFPATAPTARSQHGAAGHPSQQQASPSVGMSVNQTPKPDVATSKSRRDPAMNTSTSMPADIVEVMREAAGATMMYHTGDVGDESTNSGEVKAPSLRQTHSENGNSVRKAFTVTLLPAGTDGECAFNIVVPKSGKRSIVSVQDLEREVQLRLDIQQRVRLEDVQVENDGAGVRCLADAADGSVITARPANVVVVRARVLNETSAGESLGSVSPNDVVSSTHQFVALSLNGKLDESSHAVAAELRCTLPPGCTAELRRASPFDGNSGGVAAGSGCTMKNGALLSSVRELCNGDSVVLTVCNAERDRDRLEQINVAETVHVTPREEVMEEGDLGKEKGKSISSLGLIPNMPQKLMKVSVSSPARKDYREQPQQQPQHISSQADAAVREAVDKLIAVPARLPLPIDKSPLPRPPPPYRQSSPPSPKTPATIPAPAGGRLYPEKTAPTTSIAKQGRPLADKSNPILPIRESSPGGYFGTGATKSTASSSRTRSPSSRRLRHGLGEAGSTRGVPIPAPAPAPIGSSYPASMFTLEPLPSASSAVATEGKGPPTGVSSPADEAAISELVGMGFDREHVVSALRVCGRGDAWKEAAISLLLEPQISPSEIAAVGDPEMGSMGQKGVAAATGAKSGGHASTPPARPACPICLSDIPAEEVFTVNCKEQHVFCLGCLYKHCIVQLLDSGLIPACPLSNMSCGHELSQDDVERSCTRQYHGRRNVVAYITQQKVACLTPTETGVTQFEIFLLTSAYGAVGNCISGDGPSTGTQSDREKRALDTCRNLLTRRGLEATGAVPCVSAECGNWMVPQHGGNRVRCDSCLKEFCQRCKRSPYHYAAECGDVVGLAREWASWLTEGKVAFLKVLAAQDDQHRALLKVHQEKKNEHELAAKEAERVREDYDKMEDWKEKRCRLCPKCGRTIEKLSGCDSMKCGMDTHGGNAQNGCGAHFHWLLAPPYVGDRGVRKETPFTETEPQAAARAEHLIAPGIPLRCDRCHRDVVGPLFRCVHCPSFACCLECQDAACRDPRHVHHTFQIVGQGDIDSSSPSVPAASAGRQGSRDGGGAGDAGGGPCDMDVDDVV